MKGITIMIQNDTTITIDPTVMQNTAQTVEIQKMTIDNCIKNIIQDAGSLKNVWSGESAEAYKEATTEIERIAPDIICILNEYASDLNEIASGFLSEEQKRKVNSEALPDDVFGV